MQNEGMGWLLTELSIGLVCVGVWSTLIQDFNESMWMFSYRTNKENISLLNFASVLLQLKNMRVQQWGQHDLCGRDVCFHFKQGRGLRQCRDHYCEIKNDEITIFKVQKKAKDIISVKVGYPGFQVEWLEFFPEQ